MAGCNRTTVFPYENFDGKVFEDMPKGEFMRIAVNPYTGKVVMSFNESERYAPVVEDVLNQISRQLRELRFATHGEGGLRLFADMCDGKVDKRELKPEVTRMVHEGVYSQMAYLEMVG